MSFGLDRAPFHGGRCNSRASRSLTESTLLGSRRSGGLGMIGERAHYGRESCPHLEEPAVIFRQRPSNRSIVDDLLSDGYSNMGGIDGPGGMGLHPGGRLPRVPMMPNGQGLLGFSRSPRTFEPRMPHLNNLRGHRQSPQLYPENALPGRFSRDPPIAQRSPLMSGALPSPFGPGSHSRFNSPAASSVFDLNRMDRPRMPYGPMPRHHTNYRAPYVEDYESESDAEMMEHMLRERGIIEYQMQHGMDPGPFPHYDEYYMYEDGHAGS